MYCEECGAKNNEKNKFCEKCGHRLIPEEVKEEPVEVKEDTKKKNKKTEVKKEIKEEPVVEVATPVPSVEPPKAVIAEPPVSQPDVLQLTFEDKKYQNYISYLKVSVILTYIIWVGLGVFLGLFLYQSFEHNLFFRMDRSLTSTAQIAAIFPPIIGFAIAWSRTLAKKIQIQEMKWRLDFYHKHVNH